MARGSKPKAEPELPEAPPARLRADVTVHAPVGMERAGKAVARAMIKALSDVLPEQAGGYIIFHPEDKAEPFRVWVGVKAKSGWVDTASHVEPQPPALKDS